MATPDFILELRKHVGHIPLWLPGVTAIVLREAPESAQSSESPIPLEVLLVRRSDNGQWTPVTGISDPGEDPHTTAIREAKEETGLDIEVQGLIGTGAVGPVTYPNGDVASFLDVAVRCSVIGDNTPTIGDDESIAVQWHPVTDLPPMKQRFHMLVGLAVAHLANQKLESPAFKPKIGYES